MEYISDNKKYLVKNSAFPPVGNVRLTGGRLKTVFDNNIAFLKKFDLDRMMYWFRVSAGKPATGAPYGFGNGHFENNLYGQTAGMFLMSAGTALLWREDKKLRDTVNLIVEEIAEYLPEDGCIIPVDKKDRFTLEYPNYVRAWLTFGLLAAGYSGNETAFKLARRLGDWFNNVPEAKTAKDMNLGFQGILADTELYVSPVGEKADLDTAQTCYREEVWLDKLINGDSDALYRHTNHPHGTVLTAIEGYLDIYRITGEKKLLECVKSVLKMVERDWQHIGGGIVMCEQTGDPHYPGCGFISNGYSYNELCCTTFWVLLNQRMGLIEKDNPHYYDQIEDSLYNMLAAAQVGDTGYHYLGRLEGAKDYRYTDIATCCAATGSRLASMLPQFLYTYDSDTVYINICADSVIQIGGSEIEVKTALPYGEDACIKINKWAHSRMKLRIPSWCARPVSISGVTASPGEYLTLEGIAAGTVIHTSFPFAVTAVLYKGADVIPGKERYAFRRGPLLLCALRSKNANVECNINNPVFKPSKDGRFILEENYQLEFLPYIDINDEPFTAYPVVEAKG